jgi:hypothetical protein
MNFDTRESLREYLCEVIASEEQQTAEFYTPESGAVYRFNVLSHGEWNDGSVGSYSTFDKVWQALCEDRDLPEDNITSIKVYKEYIDSTKKAEARFNPNGELLTLYRMGENWDYADYDELEMIFIHLPVPFVTGDLVMSDDGEPCVLAHLPHWDEARYERQLRGEMSDGTDMVSILYLFCGGCIDLSHDYGYWNLRYRCGELKGRERFLRCLSGYLKDDNGHKRVDWLLNAFLKYKAEAEYDRVNNSFRDWYHSTETEEHNAQTD